MKFPSKRDAWLMLLLWTTVSIEFVAGVVILWQGPERWPGMLLLLSAGFIGWLMATTYYVVEEHHLRICCGPFRWTILLSTIESITPTHNPLSSPALSLDRLWVTYHIGNAKRAIMISPLDKAAFLEAIIVRVPQLEISGTSAVRKES